MKPPIGRVYVLSNPSIQGLVKIGFTMNTVEGRVKELSSATGIPTDFEIEYQVECRDPENIEKLVHSFLQNKRHNERREFFCVSAIEAAQAVRKHTTEILDEESRIDFSGIDNIKKTASEYKRESQSINNWEEIECIYWKTFISRSHYFRNLNSIVLWQMISVHSNKKMKGFQSSVSKKKVLDSGTCI